MSMDFTKIEAAFHELLGTLAAVLSESERQEVSQFVDVGEYGVALETLSALLVEERKQLPAAAYSQMVELSEAMGIRASVITPELESRVT